MNKKYLQNIYRANVKLNLIIENVIQIKSGITISVAVRVTILKKTIRVNSTALRCRSLSAKISKKCTCAIMIRIIVSFANQLFL